MLSAHRHTLNLASNEVSLLNDVTSRRDGRGYAVNVTGKFNADTAKPNQDDQATANFKDYDDYTAQSKEDDLDSMGLEESTVASSSCSSVSSGESDDSRESADGAYTLQKNDTQWPLRGIKEPGEHDVLVGRGGGTNYHSGNIKYRTMVDENKDEYKASSRGKKPAISMKIIHQWRSQDPPGRFLKLNNETRSWDDIGDEEAQMKVSQALRERRPSKLVPESIIYTSHVQTAATQTNEPNCNSRLPNIDMGSTSTTWTISENEARLKANQSGKTAPQNNMSILVQCLVTIGITDFSSLLSGNLEEEFQTIKQAYFRTVLRVHPECSSRDDQVYTSFQCARASFEVLRSMFHKVRAQQSSFLGFLAAAADGRAGDLGYVRDILVQHMRNWQSNHSFKYFAIAATQENPTIHVELSPDSSHNCTGCNNKISSGEIRVGSGQCCGHWQHMNCWSVPPALRSGLTRPFDSEVALRDVLSMDEIFFKGIAKLDYASQLEFTRYLCQNLPSVRANASQVGQSIGEKLRGGPNKEGAKKHNQYHNPREVVRPLKKRAVVVNSCVELEKPSNHSALEGSSLSVTHQSVETSNAPCAQHVNCVSKKTDTASHAADKKQSTMHTSSSSQPTTAYQQLPGVQSKGEKHSDEHEVNSDKTKV